MGFPIAIITAMVAITAGLVAAGQAKRAGRNARANRVKSDIYIKELEDSRQKITNPYRNVKDLSSMATDLSDMVTNPFSNLGVATKAAEIQIEQTDIALANALDTLRATGASAGGATALAQAAKSSKKEVAASIEAQEAQNEKLSAQGEQQKERLQMQELARIQGVKISEGQRLQMAEAQGEQFMFGAREGRQMQQLNRAAGMSDRYAQQEMQAGINQTAAYTGALTALGSLAGSSMGTNAYGKTGKVKTNINGGSGKVTSNAGVGVDPFIAGGYYN